MIERAYVSPSPSQRGDPEKTKSGLNSLLLFDQKVNRLTLPFTLSFSKIYYNIIHYSVFFKNNFPQSAIIYLRVRQAGFLNSCIALEISSFNGLNDATSLLRKTDRFVSPTLTRYQSGESSLELQFLFRFQDYCPPSSTMSVELNQILQRNVVTLSSSLLPPLTRPGLGVCSVGFLFSRFGCPLFCTLVRRLVILCAERSRFLSQNFDLIAR